MRRASSGGQAGIVWPMSALLLGLLIGGTLVRTVTDTGGACAELAGRDDAGQGRMLHLGSLVEWRRGTQGHADFAPQMRSLSAGLESGSSYEDALAVAGMLQGLRDAAHMELLRLSAEAPRKNALAAAISIDMEIEGEVDALATIIQRSDPEFAVNALPRVVALAPQAPELAPLLRRLAHTHGVAATKCLDGLFLMRDPRISQLAADLLQSGDARVRASAAPHLALTDVAGDPALWDRLSALVRSEEPSDVGGVLRVLWSGSERGRAVVLRLATELGSDPAATVALTSEIPQILQVRPDGARALCSAYWEIASLRQSVLVLLEDAGSMTAEIRRVLDHALDSRSLTLRACGAAVAAALGARLSLDAGEVLRDAALEAAELPAVSRAVLVCVLAGTRGSMIRSAAMALLRSGDPLAQWRGREALRYLGR